MTQPLSRRLEVVLGLVPRCAVLADIGTDHGRLPVAAVSRGVSARAIATDLREAPLRGARAHIAAAGMTDRVLPIEGDGLLALGQLEVSAVVMAGMSGGSMLRMFEAAPGVVARLEHLTLQPNQGVGAVRAWALRNGWHLRDERVLEERGQFFVVCAFDRAQGPDPAYRVSGWAPADLCSIGPRLLARKDEHALRWFEGQRARVARWMPRDPGRLGPELDVLEAACRAMRPAAGFSPLELAANGST